MSEDEVLDAREADQLVAEGFVSIQKTWHLMREEMR